IVKKELKSDVIKVDTGCIVAFSPGLQYDIERAGNLKSMFFGGEGLFLATLRGTGTVYLQSMPFSRLADRIIASAPSVGGSSTDAGGSIVGGIVGGLLGGGR
ncbi:MAG: AIM24 family protein, partial [Candidatus Sericytochromatia bacterium]